MELSLSTLTKQFLLKYSKYTYNQKELLKLGFTSAYNQFNKWKSTTKGEIPMKTKLLKGIKISIEVLVKKSGTDIQYEVDMYNYSTNSFILNPTSTEWKYIVD